MMKRWNPFSKWWLAWAAVGTVIEIAAVAERSSTPGGTLSSTIGRVLVNPTVAGVFVVGWAYLAYHFLKHRPKK